MKKKIGLSALLIVMSLLSSCGGGNQTSTSGDDLESLGYQYLDTSAPIVATKILFPIEFYLQKCIG